MKSPLRSSALLLLLVGGIACLAQPARRLYAARARWGDGGRPRRLACEPFSARKSSVVVRAGDSLWRLVGENTGKPWVWPQVWALNPELANPHWLAVGQTIRFVAASRPGPAVASNMPVAGALPAEDVEGLAALPPPAEVAAAPVATETPAAAPMATPSPDPGEALSPPEADRTQPPPPASSGRRARSFAPDEPRAPGAGRRAPTCLAAAFLAPHDLERLGSLTWGSADGLLWRQGDRVRLKWPHGVAEGPGPWAVVRIAEGIDSVGGGGAARPHGIVATCTGIVQRPGNAAADEGEVVEAREELGVGQRLIALSSMAAAPVSFASTPADVCAPIAALEHAALAGNPLRLVFFDHGSADGLKLGSLLGGPGQGRGDQRHAIVQVVQLGAHTATARPLSSVQEYAVGERFCGLPARPE